MQLAERLFQSLTPLNEKHFLPFSVPFFGNLRSVDVLRSLYDVLCEFFLNKLLKYGGASSFKLLKTIVLDSMSINSLIALLRLRQFANIILRGVTNDLSLSFIIFIEISPQPWALLGLRDLMTFSIFSPEISESDIMEETSGASCGISLPFLIVGH